MKKVDQEEYGRYLRNLKIYNIVAEILKSKVGSILLEYNLETNHNVFQYEKTRIKSLESIQKKLEKSNLEFTVENIEYKVKDLVGHRIICLNQHDVDELVKKFKKTKLLKIIEEKDYISNPKESGYRSYHIIVKNSLNLSGATKDFYSEIQIRTLLQDVWSSFEHEIVYKNKNCSEATRKRLRDLSVLFNFAEKQINDIKTIELSDKKNDDISSKLSKKNTAGEEYHRFISNLKIYSVAEDILKTKVNLVLLNYSLGENVNDIQNQKSRIKSFEGIQKKLEEYKLEVNNKNILENVRDLVGYRIVCLNLKDVADIVSLIKTISDFEIVREKDYISNPKASGYRGYHFNVLISVPLSSGIIKVPAEIQIRTLLQETWATYEEEIVYHNKNCSEDSKKKLIFLSETFNKLEREISEIQDEELIKPKKLIKKQR